MTKKTKKKKKIHVCSYHTAKTDIKSGYSSDVDANYLERDLTVYSLQFTRAHTKNEEMRILPPQPIYNFSFQNMLLKQYGYILWSDISIPIDLKKKKRGLHYK